MCNTVNERPTELDSNEETREVETDRGERILDEVPASGVSFEQITFTRAGNMFL